MSDIKDRLEQMAGFVTTQDWIDDLLEAAAEIERLREQVRVLREECKVHRDQYLLCGASTSDDVREAIAATDAAKAMEEQ